MIDQRTLKILYNKSGGTAGKNCYTTRLTLPKTWIDEMGFSIDDRNSKVFFDGKKIIIEKA